MSEGSLKIFFDFAFGCKQNMSVELIGIDLERSIGGKKLRFMTIFRLYWAVGCHMAERNFFYTPSLSSDYKALEGLNGALLFLASSLAKMQLKVCGCLSCALTHTLMACFGESSFL